MQVEKFFLTQGDTYQTLYSNNSDSPDDENKAALS
jgi:hypothetical protein